MKFLLVIVAVVVAAQAAPAAEVLLQDSSLHYTTYRPHQVNLVASSVAALSRSSRQAEIMPTPMPPNALSQLLTDILQIPQSALQAVSHLLTNPGNTIGQTFNYASPPQQQPPV